VLIPLRHEGMQTRRWPVITAGLVVLNVLAFLGTHWKMDAEATQTIPIKLHILLLAATHPEVQMPRDVGQFVQEFRGQNPVGWGQIQSRNRRAIDGWDVQMHQMEDAAEIQGAMDSLAAQYAKMEKESIRERYAFTPAHPTAISYLTANFLHGGWLHLIGNMWFLWLAGVILEDTWGRLLFSALYLVAGIAALEFHSWVNPGSMVPLVGASGAIAALMGAFLVRFPGLKIEMAWLFGIFRAYRFKASAYWLLPLWVLMEVFYGSLFGQASGVAHWAHVGGFVFGALAALGMRYSGLEQVAEKAVEEKITWTADPKIVEASELLEKGQLDAAAEALKRHLAEKPDSTDAYSLLQRIYSRKNDQDACDEASLKLCQLYLKARNPDAAWRTYEDFLSSGGKALPASSWLDLCRYLESQQNLERAAGEYQKLAAVYPNERQGLLALMSAGRLCLKQLNRPDDALRLYEAAEASSVPHLDWEPNLKAGIAEAKRAITLVKA